MKGTKGRGVTAERQRNETGKGEGEGLRGIQEASRSAWASVTVAGRVAAGERGRREVLRQGAAGGSNCTVLCRAAGTQ